MTIIEISKRILINENIFKTCKVKSNCSTLSLNWMAWISTHLYYLTFRSTSTFSDKPFTLHRAVHVNIKVRDVDSVFIIAKSDLFSDETALIGK